MDKKTKKSRIRLSIPASPLTMMSCITIPIPIQTGIMSVLRMTCLLPTKITLMLLRRSAGVSPGVYRVPESSLVGIQ